MGPKSILEVLEGQYYVEDVLLPNVVLTLQFNAYLIKHDPEIHWTRYGLAALGMQHTHHFGHGGIMFGMMWPISLGLCHVADDISTTRRPIDEEWSLVRR